MRDLASVLPSLGLLAFLLQRATAWQAGYRELAVAAVAVVLTQVLPGVLLWRLARPRAGWWVEDLAMGFAVGAALAVPFQMLTAWTSQRWVAWSLPMLVVALTLAVPAARSRVLGARTAPLPWGWGPAIALATVLPVVSTLGFFRQPLRWTGRAVQYVDLPYHLALAGRALHEFPPHYPQVGLEPLAYHWFSHAWMAQVAATSGTELDVILLRFMPALLAVLVPVVAAVAAMRISGRVWAGPLAAMATFGVAMFDVWGMLRLDEHIVPLSPSQSFASLLLPAVVTVLVMRWRGEVSRAGAVLLVLLVPVAGGAKGTVLPVLVVGLVVATLAAYALRRPERHRVGTHLVLVVGVLLVLMRVLFRGGDGGMEVRLFYGLTHEWGRSYLPPDAPTDGPLAVAWVLLVMVALFGVVVAAGLVLLRHVAREPALWLLAGCGAAGAGAMLVFRHPGGSQGYFALTALVPAGLLVGWALAVLLDRCARPLAALAVGLVAGVSAVLVTRWWPGELIESDRPALDIVLAMLVFALVLVVLAVLGTMVVRRGDSGPAHPRGVGAALLVGFAFAGAVPFAQVLAKGLPDPEPPAAGRGVHRSEVTAARWIREHSEPGDLVMTNDHCRTGTDPCDHAEFTVGAFSERRVLLEGWAYTKRINAEAAELGVAHRYLDFWDPELLALNDGFVEQPTEAAQRELYELGVRWVYVDRRLQHAEDLGPYAERRFENKLITVHELLPPGAQG